LDERVSPRVDLRRGRILRKTIGLLRETGTTAMIVTHDPAEAASVGDRIALLQRGRLLQCGSAEDLYARPTTAFAARFFSEVNEVRGTCRRGRVETPLGSFAAPHLAEHAAARVCIRPEHLRVASGPTGIRARVLASEFQGEIDRVTLDVAGLTAPLSLRAFGRARLVPGNAVYLEFESSHAVVVADDEG
jgi:iron(III) transport system ATP-binding protein